MEKQNNLIAITPNCFIIRTQAGFRKLCKVLGCYEDEYGFAYHYNVMQITDDKNAIEKEETHIECDDDGYEIFDGNGNPKTYTIEYDKQYPIKYPCILTFQDETFEHSTYKFYIKYVFDDLKIKDFISEIDKCSDFYRYDEIL